MRRIKRTGFLFLILGVLWGNPLCVLARTNLPAVTMLDAKEIALVKGMEYKIPIAEDLSEYDYELLGDEDILILTDRDTVKAKKCGSVSVTYWKDGKTYSYEISVYPKSQTVTEDIYAYPYLTIEEPLTIEASYLLQYEYDRLEPSIKEALLTYKVPIVISNQAFEEKNDNVVGLFSYEGNPYIIYIRPSIQGIDSFIHEVGHFWSAVNGGLCNGEENQTEFFSNPYQYNNYNPDSISEFYACKFKQTHMKDFLWYPYGMENGYSH